jgi:hypothetical protein
MLIDHDLIKPIFLIDYIEKLGHTIKFSMVRKCMLILMIIKWSWSKLTMFFIVHTVMLQFTNIYNLAIYWNNQLTIVLHDYAT